MLVNKLNHYHVNKAINPLTAYVNLFFWLLTGAFSCTKAVPPMAGAALHPSQDDPGDVHPHFTLTGQLSQHQTVHITMREETSFVLDMCFGRNLQLSLSSFSATSLEYTKTLSELGQGKRAREKETASVS